MSETTDDCSICLDSLDNEEEVYTLNCEHKYHNDCITRWLHTNPNCPLCREPVDADHRYVDDGIMTEERRQYIQGLKTVWLTAAKGLEWLFPTNLNGFTEHTVNMLDTDDGKELLNGLGDYLESAEANTVSSRLRVLAQWVGWMYPQESPPPEDPGPTGPQD